MLKKFRTWVLAWLFKPELDGIIKLKLETEQMINLRVAEAILKIDPWELIMKEYHGVFSEEYKRPEESLDAPGQLQMYMMGYRLVSDPAFKQLIDWIMNTQGNATMRAPNLTRDTALNIMLYGRSQISVGILLNKEIGRLASLYQEMMEKRDDEKIISTSVVGE